MATKFNVRGKLTVTVHSARELSVKQLIGEMDPYCKFEVKGEKFKTPVAENGHRAPKWEYKFICNLDGDEDAIHLKVYNKGNVTDDLMSRADIELPNLDLSGKPDWYSLRDPDNFSKVCGEVSLSLVFEGNGLPLASKALATHTARTGPTTPATPGGPAIVPLGMTSPMGSPQYQQQSPQYAQQQPPMYAQSAPMQQQQPQYQQQPPQYAQQQPQYQQPIQQQPMYQQPIQQQPIQYQQPGVVYQQPIQQQPMYQQPIQQQPTYAPLQPQPVIVVQQQPAPSMFSGIAAGMSQLANQATQAVNSVIATGPQYKGKFDPNGYLNCHPDVRAAKMEGFGHYERHGHGEGRIIALTNGLRGKFDPMGYLALHPDVKRAGMDAGQHFLQYGYKENRDVAVIPHSAQGIFDKAGYLTLHPDVKNANMDAWDHYLRHGKGENRRITVNTNGTTWSGTFDAPGYVNCHADLIAARVEGWTHFSQYYTRENRVLVVKF